ncbi:MAG: 4Fe-4S dicluster domain-containing protein [Bacteroidales bacterium]
MKQIIFIAVLLITLAVFAYTVYRLIALFKLTKPAFPVKNFGKRLKITMEVVFGQTKIFRFPLIGFLHALVFWGFCIILIGSIEMVVDGITDTERVFHILGVVYDIIIGAGDVFALIIAVAIIAFLIRRIFLHVQRFQGSEMKRKSHVDANFALSLILLLMISLLGMNTFYVQHASATGEVVHGIFPVSEHFAGLFSHLTEQQLYIWHEANWWVHILLIFFFVNYLPYSKHFHVFMSAPNVFLSRLEPLGKLDTMEDIKKEVKMMLGVENDEEHTEEDVQRFGLKDVEDVTWKNYLDSLSCTQCGRCTSVCPANITGKDLSPRKLIMDLRARMAEKGPEMLKKGKNFDDGKSLIKDYISEAELWACTTCNACAQECPININQPTLIVEMRRYLVMEEANAPGELNAIFNNIENNGAPWQYSQEDRMLWAKELYINQ